MSLGGHPALDYLNTVIGAGAERTDALADGVGLVQWLEAVSLATAEDLRRAAHAPAAELNRTAARARALREWWRSFVQRHAGSPLLLSSSRELEPLNRVLRRDAGYRQLVVAPVTRGRPTGANVDWRRERHWSGPETLLALLVETVAEFMRTGDFRYVRPCAGVGCTRWFVDLSRGHRRRWCDMGVCGNRAKARRHRAAGPQA